MSPAERSSPAGPATGPATGRKDTAPAAATQRIEDKLVLETGRASGDPDKPVREKWDEMGEKDAVKRGSGRQ